MADKKEVRVFPIKCCRFWKAFTFDDFSYDGRMTVVCHNHPEPLACYIAWKAGVDMEVYKKAVKEYKEQKKTRQ